MYGHPRAAFWCCTGTGIKSFSKLVESVYFHDDSGVWVAQYMASELAGDEKGVRLRQ
jgi:uncharacterized protein